MVNSLYFVLCFTNDIVPSQAIRLTISTQITAIMKFSHSNVGLSKKNDNYSSY